MIAIFENDPKTPNLILQRIIIWKKMSNEKIEYQNYHLLNTYRF